MKKPLLLIIVLAVFVIMTLLFLIFRSQNTSEEYRLKEDSAKQTVPSSENLSNEKTQTLQQETEDAGAQIPAVAPVGSDTSLNSIDKELQDTEISEEDFSDLP